MAYQVLLVDDELPALRFVQSLIEKYAPDFQVTGACSSGEKAYSFLQEHMVDVLITDISMQKLNGIDLAKKARKLRADLHIVILSGYAEFEYAQGAIQASVDDYLLKPVGISQMKQTLEKLRNVLDAERAERAAVLLPAVACDLPFDKEDLTRLCAGQSYRFALIRWGGLDPQLHRSLRATSLIYPVSPSFYSLRGRDDEEQVLIFPDAPLERFLSDVSVLMAQRSGLTTWTVIYQPAAQPMVLLPQFLRQAYPMLQQQSVLGKHQILPVALTQHTARPATLSASEVNQLLYFCSAVKYADVKAFFLNLAAVLESSACPQQQVWDMLHQLVLSLAPGIPQIKKNIDRMMSGIAGLFPYASSYGDLLTSVYAVLFEDESNSRDRKLSTRELYDFAVRYIDENYASPLSVQSVCDELGISQTYLSRLFRKYSDTTFNNCLMRCRMEAAKTLLREKPWMLLRDVAACVGYDDSSYFSKVFHQYTGQTPSQYVTEQK